MQSDNRSAGEGTRIDSWKEIAAFFGRDERTVKRWEKTRNLPVHRLPGDKGGVFAYTAELTDWLNSAAKERSTANGIQAEESASTVEVPQANAADLTEILEENPAEAPTQFLVEPHESSAGTDPYSRPRGLNRTTIHMLITFGAIIAGVFIWAKFPYFGRTKGEGNFVIRQTGPASDTAGLSTAGSRAEAAAAHGVDPAAQEQYLKGRYYWNHRTDGSLRLAVEAFTQAVVRDPKYAPAYAGLADCYDLMPQYTSMRTSEAFPLAISAARKAVALDDSLSEAHRALAFGLFYNEWDVVGAFREYERAIALDPKDVEAHNWYATSLLLAGNVAKATEEIEKARELDPTSRVILANQALIAYTAGEHRGSVEKLKELEQTEPDFSAPAQYLAQIYFKQQMFPEYVVELKKKAAISKNEWESALADAVSQGYAKSGRRGALEAMRSFLEKSFREGKSSGYELADVCALLDRKEDADRYLQAAVDAGDFQAMDIVRGDFAARLSGDPGYERIKQQVLQRMERGAAH
jgi:tetratricopeptide (TPR) repeat protein